MYIGEQMSTAQINDIEMYYEIHGATCLPAAQADPLLLIMGLGANATSWAMQLPAFRRESAVGAFDTRGSGRTDKPKSPYTMPQMADDAVALLDHLGIASAHVFGMSMGGMIAQEMALRHPRRVRALVLGGTMAGGPNAVMAGPQLIQQWVSTALLPLEQAIENGLRFLYSEEFIERNRERLPAPPRPPAPPPAPPAAPRRPTGSCRRRTRASWRSVSPAPISSSWRAPATASWRRKRRRQTRPCSPSSAVRAAAPPKNPPPDFL